MAQETNTPGKELIKQIGGYRIEEKIGQGGMGVVFKATQLSMDRVVALKILPPKHSKNELFTKRFLREAQSAGRLHHPNIVSAFEAGKSPEGYFYFAMEYVEGEALKALIKRLGPVNESRATEIVLDVARGLEHADKNGLIHRDVKPDNVLLATDGMVKLADFGLAKAPEDTTVTQMGTVVGSPAYMSPEQAQGDTLDIRSDIYSLGATFYNALVGAAPYEGDTSGAVIHQHLNALVPNAHEANPDVSENVSKVIEKMMTKDPSERYQTVTELIVDLELLVSGGTPKAAISSLDSLSAAVEKRRGDFVRAREQKPFRAPIIGVIAGALAAATGFYFIFLHQLQPKPDGTTATTPAVATVPSTVPPETPSTPTVGQVKAPSTPPGTPTLGVETKTPEPEKTPGGETEAGWSAALRKAIEFREENPDDFAGQLERFQAPVILNEGEPAADDIHKAITQIQKEWDEAARAALAALKKKAETHAKAGHFGSAIDVFEDFPKRLRNEAWAAALEKEAEHYREVTIALFENIKEQADEAIERGDHIEARSLYYKAKDFGIEDISEKVETALHDLKEREQQARAKFYAIKEEMAYLRTWTTIRDTLRKEEFENALKIANDSIRKFRTEKCRLKLHDDAEDIRNLLGLLEKAAEGIKTIESGEILTVGGMRGMFEGFKDGKINLRMSGVNLGKQLDRLPVSERLGLATRSLNSALPETDIILALVQIYAKRPSLTKARKHMKTAQSKGVDISHLEEILARFDRSQKEDEASKLYAEARNALKRRNGTSARAAAASLFKNYADTGFVAQNKNRIQKLLNSFSASWPAARNGLVFLWRKPSRKRKQSGDWFYDLEARGKAHIDRAGVMYVSDGSYIAPNVNKKLLKQCMATNELTIEAILTPDNLLQRDPALIISFSTDDSTRNFTLGQSSDNIILRLRTSISGARRNGHELPLFALGALGRIHVVVVYSPGSLVCYVNGEEARKTSEVQGDFGNWTPHHFVIGDEYNDPRDWDGTVEGVAIYSRALGRKEVARNFKVFFSGKKRKRRGDD